MAFRDEGFNSDGFDSSGFDDFDDFGSDDMLDFGGQSQDNNSGGFSGDFDDNFDANLNPGNTIPNDAFAGMYSDDATGTDSDDDSSNFKKTAIIAIVVGVIVVLGAIFIGTRLLNKEDKPKYDNSQVTVVDDNYIQQQQPVNNASDVLNSGVTPPGQGSNYNPNNTTTNDNWILLDSEEIKSETVQFDTEYKEHIFTVTEIKHYAKKTDNYTVLETRLIGSLSGISGTYEIRLSYDKGSKLIEGNEINVWVLFGSYNGNKVVGDITWR